MQIKIDEWKNCEDTKRIRAYELCLGDVYAIQPPQPHKKKFKIGQILSARETDVYCLRKFGEFDGNLDKQVKVVAVNYKKFPWWQFWNIKKYVTSYYFEVIGDKA